MASSPYCTLNSAAGEIRLLVLLPAKDRQASIVCRLETALLSSNPDYEALSYTWGSPGKCESISLNNVPFQVWENAAAALYRLRLPSQPRRLWIDAICINQRDNAEKSQQLLLMQRIYPQARQVCIWLGELTPLGSVGMRRLTSTFLQKHGALTDHEAELMLEHGRAVLPIADDLPEYRTPGGQAELAEHVNELEWGEVRELLKRPWWSRVWIVQEAVLANSLLLLCGPEECQWEALDEGLKAQPSEVSAVEMFGIRLDPGDSQMEGMFHTISRFREKRATNHWDVSIYDLLFDFRRLDCGNPRDRIYGFLGIAPSMMDLGIVPNYDPSVTIAEVYVDFARKIIQGTGSLEILNCVREWRGVATTLDKPASSYSVFDQSRYHDMFARVTDGQDKPPRRGWAQLPPGWECVKDGSTYHFYDWNTRTVHDNSPLEGRPPTPAKPWASRRNCPKGWKRRYDNVGRMSLFFDAYMALDPDYRPPPSRVEPLANEMASLPTWAPNWAGKTPFDPEPLLDWSETSPRYCAARSMPLQLRADGDNGTLILSGIRFDDIAQAATAWHPKADMPVISRRGHAVLEEWETLALSTPPQCPYGGPEGRKEALWRTYIADYAGTGSAPKEKWTFIEAWYDRVGWTPKPLDPNDLAGKSHYEASKLRVQAGNDWEWTKLMTDLQAKAKSTRNPFKIVKNSIKFAVKGPREYGAYARRIQAVCAHRRLFVTRRGYMGLAPWNAQPGDVVAVLYGGKTPFLLRQSPAPGVYSVVGECFVHGIMGGEALGWEHAIAAARDFRIV